VGFSIALTESIGDDGVVVVVAALLVAVVVHDVVAARFRFSVSSLDRSSRCPVLCSSRTIVEVQVMSQYPSVRRCWGARGARKKLMLLELLGRAGDVLVAAGVSK